MGNHPFQLFDPSQIAQIRKKQALEAAVKELEEKRKRPKGPPVEKMRARIGESEQPAIAEVERYFGIHPGDMSEAVGEGREGIARCATIVFASPILGHVKTKLEELENRPRRKPSALDQVLDCLGLKPK